ncbi:TIGR03773 family transporter-associated surface protein [Streptomyces sp. LaPpAH-108]|uniref:TIGR03773 family transporter-associated surface protein n=1 Tax=Streptomyces sp. LaPpAH-108 TaxID=1155714 RepID=UPI00035F6E6F|nr:TIGR03773 family transporter-associated surface protein [Streptomyces sp. LaPpAH-108]
MNSTRSRRRTGALLVAGAALLTVASPPAAVAVPAASPTPGAESDAATETGRGRTVIGDGHIDMGPRFDHGRWTVQIRDDTGRPAVWRDTEDVVLQVKDRARVVVPEDRAFGFLGAPGSRVWLLPQVQQEGVLWPGWNSQDPEVAATVDREVTWQLLGAEGPGDFLLFLNGSFGTPTVVFDARKKLPQETGIEVNSHVHGNWAFTRPGTYLLRIRMSAKTKDGTGHTDTRTLRFSVGPQDPRKAFAAGASTASPEPPKQAPADRESAAPLWWGTGAAVVAALAAVVVVLRRRPRTEGDGPAVNRSTTERNSE